VPVGLRGPLTVLLLPLAWFGLVACAGKSDGEKGNSGSSGTGLAAGGSGAGSGGSGSGAASGTGGGAGAPESGCEYNGVRYELGESFGACAECACTPTGGVECGMGCAVGGASGTMSGGGRAGTLSSSAGAGGGAEGGSPAMGGAGLGGMGAAGGNGGGGEEPGVSEDCTLQEGELCVVGTPRGGGHELSEGMPALFTMQAAGCYSSSCTELVSADCNFIGSEHDFYVGAFFCVNSADSAACTRDCAGTPRTTCDLGSPLTAGEYTVHVSGSAGGGLSTLRFTVPGVIAEEDRCTHPLVR
jgi:hypothetical protein